jgi:aspartate kinase
MSVAVELPNGDHGVNGTSGNTQLLRGNDSANGWVVQKFGGTSVGKFAVNIAEDIVR